MAVTPSSLEILSEEELAIISRVETSIDAELRLKFKSGKPVEIRNVLIRPVLEKNEALFVELKNRYSLAGWNIVEYQSKEGLWLSLSEQ